MMAAFSLIARRLLALGCDIATEPSSGVIAKTKNPCLRKSRRCEELVGLLGAQCVESSQRSRFEREH